MYTPTSQSRRNSVTGEPRQLGVGGVSDSKEMLYSIGWQVNVPKQQQPMMSAGGAAAGLPPRHKPIKRVVENAEGNYVSAQVYERHRKEEEARRQRHAAGSGATADLLKSIFSLPDDDAKAYEGVTLRIIERSNIGLQLLSGFCAGFSVLLLLVLEGTVVTTSYPAGNFTVNSSAVLNNSIVNGTNLTCQLPAARDCAVVASYASLYQNSAYFFFITSLLGLFMALAPFGFEASMFASHRTMNKQRKAAEAARLNAKEGDDGGVGKPAENFPSHSPAILLKHFFNVSFVSFFGALICTVIVAQVEYQLPDPAMMLFIDAATWEHLKSAIIARAVLHFAACLLHIIAGLQKTETSRSHVLDLQPSV